MELRSFFLAILSPCLRDLPSERPGDLEVPHGFLFYHVVIRQDEQAGVLFGLQPRLVCELLMGPLSFIQAAVSRIVAALNQKCGKTFSFSGGRTLKL